MSEEEQRDSHPAGPTNGRGRPAHGILASLEEIRFRWLFASNAAFFLGMGGQQILRSWIVFRLTESELALGLVTTAVALPMLFIAPLGGAVADRMDRTRLVAIAQATVVLSQAIVLALLFADRLRFWHLLTLATIMGIVFPFMMPARQAIVANVVGRSRLTNAMALSMAAVNTTRVVGPAMAGMLIGVVGVTSAYGINVGLFVVALTFLAGVGASPPSERVEGESLLRNMQQGFAYLASDRLVLVLLFFGLVPMFLAMPFQSLLVVFADHVWQVGAEGLGMLGAASGLGGVVGAVLVAWRSNSTRRLGTMLASVVGFGVFLSLFALSPSFVLALPAVFLANVFAGLFGALNNTAIQVLIPDRVRGRVSSLLMMSFSLPLLGTLPVSAAAEVWGAPRAVAGAAVLAMVAAVLFYLSSPALRTMNTRMQAALWEEIATENGPPEALREGGEAAASGLVSGELEDTA